MNGNAQSTIADCHKKIQNGLHRGTIPLVGAYSFDGCKEFKANGGEGTSEALACAVCYCPADV